MSSHFLFFSATVSEVPEAQNKIPNIPRKKKTEKPDKDFETMVTVRMQ